MKSKKLQSKQTSNNPTTDKSKGLKNKTFKTPDGKDVVL